MARMLLEPGKIFCSSAERLPIYCCRASDRATGKLLPVARFSLTSLEYAMGSLASKAAMEFNTGILLYSAPKARWVTTAVCCNSLRAPWAKK